MSSQREHLVVLEEAIWALQFTTDESRTEALAISLAVAELYIDQAHQLVSAEHRRLIGAVLALRDHRLQHVGQAPYRHRPSSPPDHAAPPDQAGSTGGPSSSPSSAQGARSRPGHGGAGGGGAA